MRFRYGILNNVSLSLVFVSLFSTVSSTVACSRKTQFFSNAPVAQSQNSGSQVSGNEASQGENDANGHVQTPSPSPTASSPSGQATSSPSGQATSSPSGQATSSTPSPTPSPMPSPTPSPTATPLSTFGDPCGSSGSSGNYTIVATVYAPTVTFAPVFRKNCPVWVDNDPSTQTSPNCHLPDFVEDLVKVQTLCPDKIDVSPRAFTQGFPGTLDPSTRQILTEYFAIRYRAKLIVPRVDPMGNGYKFVITSDDGARLLIDGNKVLDNDGQHSPVRMESRDIVLTPGRHDLTLDYFQGPRYMLAIQLGWIPPNGVEQIIPPSAFDKAD